MPISHGGDVSSENSRRKKNLQYRIWWSGIGGSMVWIAGWFGMAAFWIGGGFWKAADAASGWGGQGWWPFWGGGWWLGLVENDSEDGGYGWKEICGGLDEEWLRIVKIQEKQSLRNRKLWCPGCISHQMAPQNWCGYLYVWLISHLKFHLAEY